MIKGSILQENITVFNVYGHNDRTSNYMKQKLIELYGEVDGFTIIVGDFNTPHSEMDRSSRQKINKDRVGLSNTISQLDLIDIYRLLHPTTAEHTFFSSLKRMFKIDHIFSHRTHFNKFKRIEIIQCLL